ncbi:hypothetical protein GGR56DRAFT_671942 [Xylariaceae sp. FL0804]|nr:hypothetical protein GGR56DRAFT_671942 [Xylariaceae sp. FL0804]
MAGGRAEFVNAVKGETQTIMATGRAQFTDAADDRAKFTIAGDGRAPFTNAVDGKIEAQLTIVVDDGETQQTASNLEAR